MRSDPMETLRLEFLSRIDAIAARYTFGTLVDRLERAQGLLREELLRAVTNAPSTSGTLNGPANITTAAARLAAFNTLFPPHG